MFLNKRAVYSRRLSRDLLHPPADQQHLASLLKRELSRQHKLFLRIDWHHRLLKEWVVVVRELQQRWRLSRSCCVRPRLLPTSVAVCQDVGWQGERKDDSFGVVTFLLLGLVLLTLPLVSCGRNRNLVTARDGKKGNLDGVFWAWSSMMMMRRSQCLRVFPLVVCRGSRKLPRSARRKRLGKEEN